MALKKKKITAKELDLLPIMNLFSILIPFLISVAVFQKLAIVEVHLPERSDMVQTQEEQPEVDDQALNLTVAIAGEYVQIVARGGMLPMLFYKEMWTFRCPSDNDTITYSPAEVSKENPPKCRDGKILDGEKFRYNKEYIHLWALNRTSEEDPGTILTSVYSDLDSAFLDGNNEFFTDKGQIKAGDVVATLAESSARRITPEVHAKMSTRPRSVYDELARTLIQIHNRFIDAPDADNIILIANDDTAFDKVISVMDRAREAGFFRISLAKLGGV